jgi:hypothetical protein
MTTRDLFLGAALAAAFLFAGCGGDGATEGGGDEGGTSGATPTVALPAGLFLDAAPEGAKDVGDLKEVAKEGEEVVVRGRIGGVMEPFTKGRAAMTIADLDNLIACSDREGDSCETPWDYCCEAPEDLLANTMTIQVVGADGRPLKADLQGASGLESLAVVVVKGKVGPRPDPNVLVVDATGIHVAK